MMSMVDILLKENADLQAGYDAARLEIESLKAQLEAVGAGGVEPLRKRCLHQISEPAQAQWVPVSERLPEPGKAVLLDIGGKTPLRAAWVAPRTLESSEEEPYGDYDRAADMHYCPEGWYQWNQHEETHWAVNETPVAWMELPAPYSAGVGAPAQEDAPRCAAGNCKFNGEVDKHSPNCANTAAPQPAARALDSVRVFWQQHTKSDALSMTMSELHDDVELALRAARGAAQAAPVDAAVKPAINVGTIGHVGSGRTTLTAALGKLIAAQKGNHD